MWVLYPNYKPSVAGSMMRTLSPVILLASGRLAPAVVEQQNGDDSLVGRS
jgi:hypothetical protein